jgi:hypothetical protein
MTPTREEAAVALDDVQRVLARTRRAIVAAHVADYFQIWGLAWMAGFGASHFTDWPDGWIWLPVVAVGVTLSVLSGLRSRRSVESSDRVRVFWFLLALVAFGAVWAVILHPFNVRHFGVYIATLFMFAYVAGGIWFGRFFVVLGLGVTGVALIGVLAAPALLDLLMAAAGGGSLFAGGLYIRRNWA